ncbi:MAG: hypothetical protein ABIT01_11020, partial [Thermoanaerobaculia bacterium]
KQGRTKDARKALAEAQEALRESDDASARLALGRTSAGIRAAEGDVSGAEKLLFEDAQRAKKAGLLDEELVTRLARARIRLFAGKGEARSELQALEREARAAGFVQTAREAYALAP